MTVVDPDLEPDVGQPTPPAGGPEDEGGGGSQPWWHSPWKLAVLGVALVFLGFAGGYALTTRGDAKPGTGSVDVGFLQDMRYHHDNAVVMSYNYLQKPIDEQDAGLRIIAGEIMLGQQLESGKMVQLLRNFGQAEANTTGTAMAWMDMPLPIERMPGLASDDQLAQLAAAQGHDADVLYAQLMKAHHEGGLHMAEQAMTRANDGAVRELATAIDHSQRDEIDELNQILTRLGAS